MNNMSAISVDDLGPVKRKISLGIKERERSLLEGNKGKITDQVVDFILEELQLKNILISYGGSNITSFIRVYSFKEFLYKELFKKYKEYEELPTMSDMVTDALGVLYDNGYRLVSGRI